MPETVKSKVLRCAFNLFPVYFSTGARITYLAYDWREIRVKLPLSWRTRNYVGTIFGGSMYAAVDPIYMMMLIKTLGKEYIVWDKAAWIRFRKPGKGTLYIHFLLSTEETDSIRAELQHVQSVERTYHVDIADAEGIVHAEIEKTIYIRRRENAA